MVDIALHVEHRYTRRLGNRVEIAIPDTPVHVTDGNAIVIAPKDLADLLGRIAVGDLCGLALDECTVSAQLGHAGLKGAARAGGGEEEQHRQDFIAQIGVRLIQGALALQVKSHIENGFDFFPGEIQVTDQIPTM